MNRRASVTLSLALHSLLHLVATAVFERHQLLGGSESLAPSLGWEPRFRRCSEGSGLRRIAEEIEAVGGDAGDEGESRIASLPWEEREKTKATEETRGAWRTERIERKETAASGLEEKKLTERISQRMRSIVEAICALGNLSRDLSNACSVGKTIDRSNVIPSRLDPVNSSKRPNIIGDRFSLGKETRPKRASVIPNFVRNLSWLKLQDDWKGTHGPSQDLHHMLFSLKTISPSVAVSGDMVGSSVTQNTDEVWSPYQANGDHHRMRRTSADPSQQNSSSVIPFASEPCDEQRTRLIVNAIVSGIIMSEYCMSYICFSKEVTTFSKTKYGFWFSEDDQRFKGMCYKESDDCSEGRYYIKSVKVTATEKMLVSAPECTHNPFIQVFLLHHRVKLPPECLLFLCSYNIQYVSIRGVLMFYSPDPLEAVQYGCLSSIHENVVSDGETQRGNNFDDANDGECYNEAVTVTYGASSDFPFEDPCVTASITISVPSETHMVILVRGSRCRYFDYAIGGALLGIYLQGRRPIDKLHLYTCLTIKESKRLDHNRRYFLSISDKYLLARALQDGLISKEMADFCCQNETSLVSISDTTGAQHVFFSMNGPIKSWVSYDSFIRNISFFSTTEESNSSSLYPSKASSIPSIETRVLPIPIDEFSKSYVFFLHTNWVSWCPNEPKLSGLHFSRNAALSILTFYDPELSKACQNILCSARVFMHEHHNDFQEYFWYTSSLSAVDKECLHLARLKRILHHENNRLALFYFGNIQTLPPIIVFLVKNADDMLLRMPRIGMDLVFLLREGKRKYVDCLTYLTTEQSTGPKVARMYFVNGTQWRHCMRKDETRPSSDGRRDTGSHASNYSTWYWAEREENESYQSSDDSLRDWFEIIDSKSQVISGISKRFSGEKMNFLAFLLKARIRFNHTTLEDLIARYRTTVEGATSLTFVFEMPLDVFIRHSLLKENTGVINCTIRSSYSICLDISGYSLMFVHNCSVSFEGREKLLVMYLSAIGLEREEEWNVCSNGTMVLLSQPLDTKRVLYYAAGNEEEVVKATQTAKEILPEWTLVRTLTIFMSSFIDKECITLPKGARLESTIRIGLCVKATVDKVDFYFKRALNKTLSVFIINLDGKRDAYVPQPVHFIRSLTSLDVNLLNAMEIENTCKMRFNVTDVDIVPDVYCREDPFTQIKVYEADLSVIIENLRQRLNVDTKTLITDTLYEWSLRNHLQTAVNAINGIRSSCLSDMIEGKSIIYREDNITFITGIYDDLSLGSCFTSLPESLLREIDEAFLEKRGTINKFWPTCGIQDVIILGREPSSSEWFYLSSGCRFKQVIFFLITLAITITTILGNLFILFIIHRYDMALILRYGPPFYILRSLAVADLLTGVFPGFLAVWDQFSLMTGYLTLYDLEEDGLYGSFFSQRLEMAEGFQDLRFKRHGYPMFCGLVMSVTSIVSLLMLLLLSVERYKGIRGQTLKCLHAIAGVWVSWALAFVFGILFFVRKTGFNSAGYFDPISKLTVSIGSSGNSLSQLIFYLEILFVAVAGCGMIFLTFYAFSIFIGFRTNRERSNITLSTGDDKSVHQHDRKYLMFFFLLVSLYVVSSLPLAANIFGSFSKSAPVFHFFAWWFFMGGSSWNWYVYTYVRKPFRVNMSRWIEKRQRLRNLSNEL